MENKLARSPTHKFELITSTPFALFLQPDPITAVTEVVQETEPEFISRKRNVAVPVAEAPTATPIVLFDGDPIIAKSGLETAKSQK